MHHLVRRAALFALALAVVSCSDRGTVNPILKPGAPQLLKNTADNGVRISEFHYDNAGTDAGESIEISGPAGTSLVGWSIVLYNGSPTVRAPYATTTLSGSIPNLCNGRGVVTVGYPSNGIQNGGTSSTGTTDPDGFALVSPAGVVEFLSYEGSFTAQSGAAAGMTSTDIGVRQLANEPAGTAPSLSRNSDHVFAVTQPNGANSFGDCNDNGPVGAVASVRVLPAIASVVAGSTQQFTAKAFDANLNRVTTAAFTWASLNPLIATVNAAGLATGTAGGTVSISATSNAISGSASLTVTGAPPPPPPLPAVRFSELHYDNFGEDGGESIEIEGPAGTDLSGWKVLLYNGNGGGVYSEYAINETIPALCSGRGVVFWSYLPNGLQNGPPDGLALVDPAGNVVEFLSYEGSMTATNGAAAGMTSQDIGVSQVSAPLGTSLRRSATGTWTSGAPSFGACNSSGVSTRTIALSGRDAADPELPVGFEDELFATLRDGATSIPTTFTYTPVTPSLSVNGRVVRAEGAGNGLLRVTAADGTSAVFVIPTRVAVASATASYEGNTEFGVPTDGDNSDDFIITRAQYTSSFNRNKGIPNWVSFNMEATHYGPEDRCDCFTFDPELVAAGATSYTTADYTGAGAFHGYGIDRGHLVRSADRTAASLDNAVTYYFSNIIPQAADNNQGPWSKLELDLGTMARDQNKEVYVIAGASGSKGTIKNEGKITIPSATWKVAVIMPRNQGLDDVDSDDDVQIIAVIMPNDSGIRSDEWEEYQATVDAVEALSGYDLLTLLPDHIEILVESNMLALLNQLVADGALNKGNANSLWVKINAALKQLERGNPIAAANQLEAIVHELDAMVASGRLTAAQAAPLRAALLTAAASISE